MTLSQDRPAFVLPWIVVVLAAFAFLPPWMGSLLGGETAGDVADGALQAQDPAPAEAVGPALLEGGLAPGRFSALPMESPLVPAFGTLASGAAPATAEAGEAVPVEATFEQEEALEQAPGGNRPQEFHHLVAEEPAVVEPAPLPAPTPTLLASAAGGSSAADAPSAAELLLERALERADGRLELELSAQALAFLLQEQLLPAAAEIAPLTEADAERRAPWDARLRAAEAVAAEDGVDADEESSLTRRQRIEQRAREFLRLLRSEPRQALSFLAVLNRAQLRELGKKLQERGVDPRSLFGL